MWPAHVCDGSCMCCASHTLVQATGGVGTVMIVYIGVPYTNGGGVPPPLPMHPCPTPMCRPSGMIPFVQPQQSEEADCTDLHNSSSTPTRRAAPLQVWPLASACALAPSAGKNEGPDPQRGGNGNVVRAEACTVCTREPVQLAREPVQLATEPVQLATEQAPAVEACRSMTQRTVILMVFCQTECPFHMTCRPRASNEEKKPAIAHCKQSAVFLVVSLFLLGSVAPPEWIQKWTSNRQSETKDALSRGGRVPTAHQ